VSKETVLDEAGATQLIAFFNSEDRPDECLMIDELDGFLTALACTPKVLRITDWIQAVWGDDDPGFADGEEEQAIVSLIHALLREIEGVLEEGNALEPWWHRETDEADEEQIEPGGWCMGFMLAVELHMDYWAPLLETEESALLIMPISGFALYELSLQHESGEEADEELNAEITELATKPELRAEAIASIPYLVQDLYALQADEPLH